MTTPTPTGAPSHGAARAASGAPPSVHVEALVLGTRSVGAYRHLTVAAPGVPERFRPGTSVAVALPGGARLARRSYWIHGVRPVGAHGPALQLVVEPRGTAGTWLAGLREGARLALTGPLGRPYALPKEPVSCLLVGEDWSAAPLLPLAERLRERGCTVTMLVAARDEAHLVSALEARRAARAVTVVTRDGSVGARGGAADVVGDVLQHAAAEVVYAAGPAATLHAVAAAAEEHGAWSQAAVTVPQPCATGLCHGCPVPVVGEDGVARTVRACTEGPVLRGDRVRWGDLRAASGVGS
jgi:dihydroorotate dehydrogenase electron transfer subunit